MGVSDLIRRYGIGLRARMHNDVDDDANDASGIRTELSGSLLFFSMRKIQCARERWLTAEGRKRHEMIAPCAVHVRQLLYRECARARRLCVLCASGRTVRGAVRGYNDICGTLA